MENFNFYSPTEFVFGKEREAECGHHETMEQRLGF